LEEPDLLLANLKVINGDAMGMAQDLGQWLAKGMQRRNGSLSRSCRKAMDVFIRLTRQIDHFGQTELASRARAAASRQ